MTTFPLPLAQRFTATIRDLITRVQRVEQRTRNVSSTALVHTVTGVVDPAYTTGDPMVTLTGAASLSGPYQVLASYTPVAGDTVLLIPSGTTYIVAGTFA